MNINFKQNPVIVIAHAQQRLDLQLQKRSTSPRNKVSKSLRNRIRNINVNYKIVTDL